MLWSSQNDGLVNAIRGNPYEEGVQLSKDRLSCFLQQSITSSLNLNSRCLLLWINVASFCVSLLIQEGERLSGILSGRAPVEKYCISQLRNIWKLMKSNMQLTDEELSYLVMMCMRRYLQVCRILECRQQNTCSIFKENYLHCTADLGGIFRQGEWDLYKCRNGCTVWTTVAQWCLCTMSWESWNRGMCVQM